MAKKSTRDSWRPQGNQGTSAVVWLIVRRIIATVAVIALLGAFVYFISLPFLQPRTYMAFMTSGQHQPLDGQPIEFAFEDFESFTAIESALARRGATPLVFTGVESPRQFEEQISQLSELKLRRNDVLILYIAAHGVVDGNEPYLKCANYSRLEPEKGLVRVSVLLRKLQALPGKTKFLILDSGREAYDFQSPAPAFGFTRLLAKKVQEVGDPSLWVLTANSNLERSHIAPALHQSVFGYVLSRGLNGAADHDQDDYVRVDELSQFVIDNVSSWVDRATDGNDSQTPQLLHHQGLQPGQEAPPLLSLKKLSQPRAEPDVREDIAAAQATDTTTMLTKVGNFIVGVSGQFGIPSPGQIALRTRPLRAKVGGLLGGSDKDADAGDTSDGTDGGNDETSEVDDSALPDAMNWADVAERRLSDAWKMVAKLEDRPEPPQAFAPHLWQSLLDELIWYEQLHHSGAMADQQLVATDVRRITRQLQFLSGESATDPPGNSLVGQVLRSVPQAPFGSMEIGSLGMAEAVATAGQPLPQELAEFAVAFDRALTAREPDDLSKLLEEKGQAAQRFSEVRYAGDLIAQSEIPWETRGLALKTRRLAEQAAADLLCGAGWQRDEIESADRLRLEAERLLKSRAESNWLPLVNANLDKAQVAYQGARRANQTVRAALLMRNEVLARCHDYLRWHCLGSGDTVETAPQRDDLVDLFDALTELDQAIAAPEKNTDLVEQRFEDLRFALRRVELGLRPDSISALATPLTGNAWRMSVLSRTHLPNAAAREALTAQMAQVSSELAGAFQFSQPRPGVLITDDAIRDETWGLVRRQLELEIMAALLASCPTDAQKQQLTKPASSDGLEISQELRDRLLKAGFKNVSLIADAPIVELAAAMASDNPQAEALRNEARWLELESTTSRLAEYYRELPTSISDRAQATGSRETRLANRRAAARDLNLLRTDVPTLTKQNLTASVRQADWYDLLLWHAERFRNAIEDAPADELTEWVSSLDAYLRLANEIPNQPAAPEISTPRLELTVESELSLDSRETEDRLDIRVNTTDSQASPVWIVLQYDSKFLRVEEIPGLPIYQESVLRSSVQEMTPSGDSDARRLPRRPSQIRDYPYRPDLFAMPPSLQLAANDGQSLTIQVSRLPEARGQTSLIVKAIGADAYARRATAVSLPGHQLYQLLVEDPIRSQPADPTTWTQTSDGVMLQPFPNQAHGYAFRLKDLSNLGGEVAVELSMPSRSGPNADLPQGALEPDAANELLRLFGSRTPLAQTTITLSPSGSTRIAFPPPADGKEDAPRPFQPIGAAAEQEQSDGPVGQIIRNGLLMVLTDAKTNKRTLKRIRFAAQRPRRFLTAQAGYNSASELLTVDVSATNENAIPPEGLAIELSFAETLDFQTNYQLIQKLSRGGGPVRLFAPIPIKDQREVTARISVNGYPRAFVFRVPCIEMKRNIPPLADLREIRVVSPKPNQAYAVRDLKEIPVRIEVDAPESAFSEAGTDFIQVGIDLDQDLDLDGENQTIQRFSDRHVDLYGQALEPSGTLTVFAKVDDFNFLLPPIGQSRAFVLGRLVTGSSAILSRGPNRPPVEIVVDGSGPSIDSVAIRPTRRIRVDSEINAAILVTDRFTRPVKVEVGFDTRAVGDFGGVEKIEEARLIKGAEWEATMKVPQLPLGPQKVWLRATDSVGNQTVESYAVQVLPKQEAGERKLGNAAGGKQDADKVAAVKPKNNRVSGRLLYGARPVREGKVVLLIGEKEFKETESDDSGRFTFSDVPPGDYQLSARGSAGGNSIKKSLQITVGPAEKGPTRLNEIQLR